MKERTKKIAGAAGSVLLLSSMGMGATAAFADAGQPEAVSDERAAEVVAGEKVNVAHVQGEFAYAQGIVTPNSVISKAFAKASQYLCGAAGAIAASSALEADQWSIAIGGMVENPCTVTVAELAQGEQQRLVMGCSCVGNPIDGTASFNAEVTGVSVASILEHVVVSDGANTIVFTSADGYEVALPVTYVTQRYCPLVFDVNGAPLAESVGGTNQLWLGSTSARYFARDVIGIRLEERATPPAAPGADAADTDYANLPNIGVAFGGEVE